MTKRTIGSAAAQTGLPDSYAPSRQAMRASLSVGVLMLAAKMTAWLLTGSAGILSDAAESVVHLAAVAFAAWSLSLSFRPANHRFPYGYERVSFFSAGFEGAMIIAAALFILGEAGQRWSAGVAPGRLMAGIALVAAAAAVNLGLGVYLLRLGKRTGSLILQANGQHVLTDSWTSFGVVVSLVGVMLTGWSVLDPLVAILVAGNILWSGFRLVSESIKGLMDYADPAATERIRKALDRICEERSISYHELRHRGTGNRTIIEVHLLFPYSEPLGEAHATATAVEQALQNALPFAVEVITHLESIEDHDSVHSQSL